MIIGLTGFSGAGKSTVAAIFKANGFYHLDCDKLVHERVYCDPAVIAAVSEVFGLNVVKDGVLNRIALRRCTMGDPEAIKKLNEAMRPHILKHIHNDLLAHRNLPIILDAPLLFESGLDRECEKVLSVIADRKVAMQRIIERDGLSAEDAEKRLSSQKNADFYIERSDYVLYNNGKDVATLEEQTLALIKKIYDQAI